MALKRDSSSVLLGFYKNEESAAEAIRGLRRAHIVRSASIHRAESGKIRTKDNDVLPREGMAIGLMIGLALAVIYYFVTAFFQDSLVAVGISAALLAQIASIWVLVLFPIVGTALGWIFAAIFDFGVRNKLLARNSAWVTRDETLIVVQGNSDQINRAHEILRTSGPEGPTIFVVRAEGQRGGVPPEDGETPELLMGERLQARAKRLAELQRVSKVKPQAQSHRALLARLRDSERVFERVEASLTQASNLEQSVSISAEWLLDNTYIVQSQIKDVRRNLPTGFYRELPVIADGPATGTPRIYSIAADLIENSDARVDRENMTDFLRAYQEVEPLKLSELWAMPLMLRMALIERLRHLTIRIDDRQHERERADFWSNRLLAATHRDADQLVNLLAELAREQRDISPHFADRLVSQLYDEEAALSGVRSWLERKFDRPIADIVQREQRRQAADQVAIANIITSLRQLLELDWREIFEDISIVHQTLSYDPVGVYGRMDFATRDRYRHAVEMVAKRVALANPTNPSTEGAGNVSGHSELAVARAAVNLAVAAPDNDIEHKKHVGYWLVDDGLRALYARMQAQPDSLFRVRRWVFRNSGKVYVGGIVLLTLLLTQVVVSAATGLGLSGGGIIWLYLLTILPASEAAVQIWDYLLSRLLHPRGLPKMSFVGGIPDEWKTLVVVPMMLTSVDEVKEDIERLEVRAIANPLDNIQFALLSDFTDADEPHTANDDALLGAAYEGIAGLNERYGNKFFLFHRNRQWCASEGKWIGWERKRGKLEELDHFLTKNLYAPRDEGADILRVGDSEALKGVRFIITLDADTQLPHDSARRLIETLAHPLNRPQLSEDGRSVVRGYTIIQPRVSTELPSAINTRFSRLFTDARGTDPYTHLVSNVYQDLSGEGAYHGKGIYDLQAFSKVLSGRFPTDTLLSHDLLEGAHVRVGLATDIELFDQFPPNYLTYAKRQHRWIRGDWQIAPWLKSKVPAHGGKTEPNVLSGLNRWKIFDNLRRSLAPIAMVALLLFAWLLEPRAGMAASILVAGYFFLPPVLGFITWLTNKPWKNPFPGHDLAMAIGRSFLGIAILPHQATVSIDAIGRVLYRRFISKKNLLEWTTASAAARGAKNQEARFGRRLLWSSLFALMAGFIVFDSYYGVIRPIDEGRADPAILFLAVPPFLALWLVAPYIVRRLSGGHIKPRTAELSAADRQYVRKISRETWRYFDDFIGEQTNWLPPDNYQEYLNVELAPRTSPTNLGLWLLSAQAAHDFGYITPDDLVKRTQSTLDTLNKLERYEGHFLNWYDIFTTQPLHPRYVSTVDSGNLLVCFWAFANGARELVRKPVLDDTALHGLADTLAVLKEKTENLSPNAQGKVTTLERLFADPPQNLEAVIGRIRAAGEPAYALTRILRETTMAASSLDPAIYWADALERQVAAWNLIIDRYLLWAVRLMEHAGDELKPLGEAFIAARRESLRRAPSLQELAQGEVPGLATITALRGGAPAISDDLTAWLEAVYDASSSSRWLAGEMMGQVDGLVENSDELADAMDMRFLFDNKRKLFSIGFNVTDRRLDNSFYDLIASECRLASFAAIARGEVSAEHWIKLRRLYARNSGTPALMSWSGTMFEYLMPLLLTHQYENSLLDFGCRAAVEVQQNYARSRGIPWGISEAAFSALDTQKTYQYHAFGVPGLGLKRGLEDDLVVAPYASALAIQVDPVASVENLRRLENIGMRGTHGFYESIDYTRQRVPEGERGVIVRNYMVHHHGMSLLAFDNALHNGIMRERFHADPRVQAASPLLYEAVPLAPPVLDNTTRERRSEKLEPLEANVSVESFGTADTPTPRVNLLSNGKYSVMTTNAGGGYSRWKDYDVTRWRADTTRDEYGQFIYIHDRESNALWSSAFHPMCVPDRRYNATFSPDKSTFRRRDAEMETFTEIIVSPEDDVEIRRVTLINHSKRARTVELTSFLELALAPHAADRAHPAFAKLFVQTEALEDRHALIAWRRPRSPKDAQIWAGHQVVCNRAEATSAFQFETDRARFLGRGRTVSSPQALDGDLTGTHGAVLDPVFSVRQTVRLEVGERIEIAFVTAASDRRETVVGLIDKYSDFRAIGRAFELSWTDAQLELHRLRIAAEDVGSFQQLAGHMLYPAAQLRAPARRLRENRLGQSRLWSYGISGDLPIIVVSISRARDIRLVKQVLQAHTFWHVRGLKTDLVILDEDAASYEQSLSDELKRIVQSNTQYTGVDQPGGVFLRGAGSIPEEDLTLLLTIARVSLVASRGGLAQQLGAISSAIKLPPKFAGARRFNEEPSPELPFMELPYFNGLGGFTTDGREYAIYLAPGQTTPAPWCNVMANENFGTLVSESGPGFCWFGNSQSNRLTPWSNDPVTDPAGEAIYIRDEDSGTFWTPTPLPIRENDAYRTRHGQGYTVFEHNSHAIQQELTVWVPQDENGGAPVRIHRLRLRNVSSRRRRLSVVNYAALTLGTVPEETQIHVSTSWDEAGRVLLARNPYHPDFGGRVSFFAASPNPVAYTGDRTEFLGRNGSPNKPAALLRHGLSNRTGAGLDPCAAMQVVVELELHGEVDVYFIAGQADNAEQALRLAYEWRQPERASASLETTKKWWDHLLDALQVSTPESSANFLLNRWLVYQDLSCRIWARSAFYQSGGAFGFRDQLQDVMAMVYASPDVARAQIVRAAARQFVEGDVQHWWHPPSGAGVRTKFSDDLLWLPFVTAHYVRTTGDASVLDEVVPFIEGPILGPDEHENYMNPTVSQEKATVLEHCRRSIKKGLTSGPHGLPLIGIGDWNDGMSRVGVEGRGESVWLAWFLIVVLRDFAELLKIHDGTSVDDEVTWCEAQAVKLAQTIEEQAWDGDYYIRAYFDNGSKLGSKESDEAKIDSLPQSWAILSGAGDPERAEKGMQAVEQHLIREEDEMILLFTPPFDKSVQDPGYIKGYVPGVRENGGQYTHAAIWVAQAFARKGDGDRAVQLLRLLNPVEHARTPEDVARYQVEPYVITADVYALKDRVGRGGWSWYTGSSSWYYRVWIEDVLGVQKRGERLFIEPSIPRDWPEYVLQFRWNEGHFDIRVENPESVNGGVAWIEVDGQRLAQGEGIDLAQSGRHAVVVRLGSGQ